MQMASVLGFSFLKLIPICILHSVPLGQYRSCDAPLTVRAFNLPSSIASEALSVLLGQPAFLSEFIKKNRARLVDHYSFCTQFFRKFSIPYTPTNAGLFLWFDLTTYLDAMPGETRLEKELELDRRLLDAGVHVGTSQQFHSEEPGWFRITFAVNKDVLHLGLTR